MQALTLAREFLGFLRQIEKSLPEALDAHLIVDNYCTHKHALAFGLPRSGRSAPGCCNAPASTSTSTTYPPTPPGSIWWSAATASRAFGYGIITQRTIRRGSFSSVKELIARIEQFVAADNKTMAPFSWTATVDSILEKLQRLCS